MKILYMNDRHAFVSFEETDGDEPFDTKEIVARATTVKSSRDFINFLISIPGSFFKWNAMPIGREFIGLDQLLDENAPYVFEESFVDTVDKHFPQIEVLDEVALKAGAIGEYTDDYPPQPSPFGPDITEGIINPKSLRCIQLGFYEQLVKNIQLLERYAAIANGEKSPFEFRRLDFDCKADVQFIDTQLMGSRVYAVGFGQKTDAHQLFTREEWHQIVETLEARGYKGITPAPNENTHDTEDEFIPIFVYPNSMSDREIAADIFVSYMYMVFDDEDDQWLNRNFVVTYDSKGFHVSDNIAPVTACYREVAYLAESNSIRLCAQCGHPLLADKSRGNEAMYCSRSCNTKASAARREIAYALAASDTPIEAAIERIGQRYENSIRRWYEESKALLS